MAIPWAGHTWGWSGIGRLFDLVRFGRSFTCWHLASGRRKSKLRPKGK